LRNSSIFLSTLEENAKLCNKPPPSNRLSLQLSPHSKVHFANKPPWGLI